MIHCFWLGRFGEQFPENSRQKGTQDSLQNQIRRHARRICDIFLQANPICRKKNIFLAQFAAGVFAENSSKLWWGWQWRGAHEARALCAKQREASPMSKGTLQAARRGRVTIANCG